MDAPTQRRSLLLLAGLLCVVIVGFLLWRDSAGIRTRLSPPHGVSDAYLEPNALHPGSTSEEAAADAPELRERSIVVLGPGASPLPGVRVRGFWKPAEWVETDADGRARIEFPPEASDTSVRLSGAVPEARVALSGAETVARHPDLIPLSVFLLDGETGDRVSGATVTLRPAHGPPLSLKACGTSFELPVAPVVPGKQVWLTFGLEPPPGYAGPATTWFRIDETVSTFAERVEVTIPVYREAMLVVWVEEANGSPAEGARVCAVRLGGKSVHFTAEPVDASGSTRIGGLPSLQGEVVTVRAVKDHRYGVSGEVRLGTSSAPVSAVVSLPKRAPPRNLRRGFGETRFTTIVGTGGRVPRGTGCLEVRAFRRDGTWAVGALIRFAIAVGDSDPEIREIRTDAAGWGSCADLPDASVTVSVREPGYIAPPPRTAEVREGMVQRLEIREADGKVAIVTVLDAEGQPVPFARLKILGQNGVAYALLKGSLQVLTHFTDASGRAVLQDLPLGDTTVTATFGSRTAEGKTSGGAPLTIRLPR